MKPPALDWYVPLSRVPPLLCTLFTEQHSVNHENSQAQETAEEEAQRSQ